MEKDKVFNLQKEDKSADPLTEVIRIGARDLIRKAVELELEEYLQELAHLKTKDGKRRIVRNGFHQERTIQTGIGSIEVQIPRTRDRGNEAEKLIFKSKLVPPYLRRTKNIEELLPWLYLKGVSTGDFSEALKALLGENAPGLSSATVSRLKSAWIEEYQKWTQRDLSLKEYVYVWVDGIYSNVRLDTDKQCLLVMIGVTADGNKELLALSDGYRESEQSWTEILLELKARGLSKPPELFIGDGAMGFWKAKRKIMPDSREQRCWVHKTANILNCFPRRMKPKVKEDIHQMWMAETRETALKEYDLFVKKYEAKYPKAIQCLSKSKEELFTFYEFPSAHWVHLRTTNPIESTFATVRLRTAKSRGCFSRETVLTMAFKLILSAQSRWRRIRGFAKLADVIEGVKFENGVKKLEEAA